VAGRYPGGRKVCDADSALTLTCTRSVMPERPFVPDEHDVHCKFADRAWAESHGVQPVARLVSYGIAAVEPGMFGLGPIRAVHW
jgi:hypothetical protein